VSGIFINHRGIDHSYAPVLVDRELTRRFGTDNVYLASRSNRAAVDFPLEIERRLTKSSLLIALIDQEWVGRDLPLLHQPGDWVRREIAWALEHGLHVLPLLLDGVRTPKTRDLPGDIAELTHRQALRMRVRTAHGDLARLVGEIEQLVPDLVLKTLMDPGPPPTTQPAALLRADYQVLPFRPREEIDHLADWCLNPANAQVRLVTGPLGEGKTRLGLRLAERLRGFGRPAGLLSASAPPAALERLGEITTPCLVVIDDAETRPEQVAAALRALAASPEAPSKLLLLARSTGSWLYQLLMDRDDRVAALVDSISPLPLTSLRPSPTDFVEACEGYARRLGMPIPDIPDHLPLSVTMLDVQAAALAHVIPGQEPVESPMRRVLQVERGRWLDVADSLGLPDPSERRLSELVAAATLFGASTEDEADTLLAGLRTFRNVPADTIDNYRDFLRTVLPGPAPLNPLMPDRLGEDLIVALIVGGYPLGEAFDSASDAQAHSALISLGRCLPIESRLTGPVTDLLARAANRLVPLAMTALPALPRAEHLVTAMTTAADRIVEATALVRIVEALPQRSEDLGHFAVKVTERALVACEADGCDPIGTARLAGLLATRLAYLEERSDIAVAAASFAVAELSKVAGSGEAAPELRAALAEAYAALALALDCVPSRGVEAVGAGDAAITWYRDLTSAGPYDGALATALNNQSIRLRHAGKIEAALATATEAHRLVAPLQRKKPAAYRSLHSDVLDTLAVVSERSGRPKDAERFGHEALKERRKLAEARPDAYPPQLADTLHNLGRILAWHGDVLQARALLSESTARYDDLAARDPRRFTSKRDLARKHLDELRDLPDD
jgi:tetratricopeptide (TPR) repeat protein